MLHLDTLVIDEHSQILEHLVDLANLSCDLHDALVPLFDQGLIELPLKTFYIRTIGGKEIIQDHWHDQTNT